MAFLEPVGFVPGHRMLVSVGVEGWRLNALASVVRCARGDDFRTYVAVSFADVYETDYDELCQRLDSRVREQTHAST